MIEINDSKKDEILPTSSKSVSQTSDKREVEFDDETKNSKKIKNDENECVEKKLNSPNENELTENITCTICNDIMHDCIRLFLILKVLFSK